MENSPPAAQSYTTQDGKTVVIRPAVENDAVAIIAYAKHLFENTDQLLTLPEEYTITEAQERQWISSAQQHPAAIILVAETAGQIVGLLDFFARPKKKQAHSGEFGVSVHKDFRGMGIGRKMIEMLLQWAAEHRQVEKVLLQVFASNHKAIALYRSLGFTEEAHLVKAIRQPSGEYADLLQMYIWCKS